MTDKEQIINELKQECEELKRKLSNQEQLYQNKIEIYDKSCLELRQENDDLYLERLALNTANSGINALLEVKEQECEELENKIKKLRKNLALEIEASDRYRKALEEIRNIIASGDIRTRPKLYDFEQDNKILDIISKALNTETENNER